MERQNRILAILPPDAYERIARELVVVPLRRGEVIRPAGAVIRDLYFPTDGMISQVITMNDGRTAETAALGNREMCGANGLMGEKESAHTEDIVQVEGWALRISTTTIRGLFDNHSGARAVLLRGVQALLAQITQNAACNRLHSLEHRFARWLLEVHSRVGRNDMLLTQEFTAQMLGVRRVSVTEVAAQFVAAGLITTLRGSTQIRHLGGLMSAACECFAVLHAEHIRLLGQDGMRDRQATCDLP